jgi:hypothetical protein
LIHAAIMNYGRDAPALLARAIALKMGQANKIVVVEDAFVRSFLKVALERHGHSVICATPAQAVELLRERRANLLITNTPAEFAEFGSTVPLLYTAAFPDPSVALPFKRWKPLRKPFQNAELISLVDQLLGSG